MSNDTDFSDEILTAFLDGELGEAEAQVISDALVANPHLEARLEALDVPMDELRGAFDGMLGDMPKALSSSARSAPQGMSYGKSALAACVILAAGIGIGAYALKPAPLGWQDYVAAYQALYVEGTLSVVEQTEEETDAQLMRVSANLGRELSSARSVPGLNYKRAQLLGFNGKPLVQMAYLDDSGAPMALCIIRSTKTASLDTKTLEGLEAASWSDGTYAYLLIGGSDKAQLKTAATYLQGQL